MWHSRLLILPNSGTEKTGVREVATYDDISGIFNMPYLEELDISGMQCEIAFDRITDNPSLKC